jgi:hypothetical protein
LPATGPGRGPAWDSLWSVILFVRAVRWSCPRCQRQTAAVRSLRPPPRPESADRPLEKDWAVKANFELNVSLSHSNAQIAFARFPNDIYFVSISSKIKCIFVLYVYFYTIFVCMCV